MAAFLKNGANGQSHRARGAATSPGNGGARTETSVMASIDDLLREHERTVARAARDAEARAIDAERARAEAARQAREDEEARAREAEDEARRRAFEAQRREAELAAMREATLERTRLEAGARARLEELEARQRHAEQLSAIARDVGKKRWKLAAVLTGVVLALALGGGTTALVVQHDRRVAAENELADLRAQIAQAERDKAQIRAQLAATQDPQRIAELTRELDDKNRTIDGLKSKLDGPRKPAPHATPGASPSATATTPRAPSKTCGCLDGDPTCTCIKI